MYKSFAKHHILRNLTCLYIALKLMHVDSRILLAIISDKTVPLS